jgi:hypothetical protein
MCPFADLLLCSGGLRRTHRFQLCKSRPNLSRGRTCDLPAPILDAQTGAIVCSLVAITAATPWPQIIRGVAYSSFKRIDRGLEW